MKEPLISFDTAILAYDKGFVGYKDDHCYYKDGSILKLRQKQCWNSWPYTQGLRFSIMPQSLLQKWLRDVFKILINVMPVDSWENWDYRIYMEDSMAPFFLAVDGQDGWDNYEEALERGLYEALKLINNEKT